MAEQSGEGLVRVLGPTMVDDAAPTTRQRRLLAALAMRAGGVVHPDSIIDAMWSGAPPTTARASLQNQVARLRARFGDSIIGTDDVGYRLGWRTDAADFEATLAPLAHASPRVDLIPELLAGLSRWRGTPFAELDDVDGVAALRARLTELHVAAEEQVAACRLAGGILEPTILDLVALTEGEPFRERRWALLMAAQHRAGRPSDALASYRRYADIVRAELGAEPSPPLQRLRERVEQHAATDHELIDITGDDPPARTHPRPTSSCGRRPHRQRRTCSPTT